MNRENSSLIGSERTQNRCMCDSMGTTLAGLLSSDQNLPEAASMKCRLVFAVVLISCSHVVLHGGNVRS